MGINTMMPAVNSVVIDTLEVNHRATKISKQVWTGQEFEPRTYYRLPMDPSDLRRAERWLGEQFGASEPRQTWWTVAGNLFMVQKVYTWYCLAHGAQK